LIHPIIKESSPKQDFVETRNIPLEALIENYEPKEGRERRAAQFYQNIQGSQVFNCGSPGGCAGVGGQNVQLGGYVSYNFH
jgi:hypothetical protein